MVAICSGAIAVSEALSPQSASSALQDLVGYSMLVRSPTYRFVQLGRDWDLLAILSDEHDIHSSIEDVYPPML